MLVGVWCLCVAVCGLLCVAMRRCCVVYCLSLMLLFDMLSLVVRCLFPVACYGVTVISRLVCVFFASCCLVCGRFVFADCCVLAIVCLLLFFCMI